MEWFQQKGTLIFFGLKLDVDFPSFGFEKEDGIVYNQITTDVQYKGKIKVRIDKERLEQVIPSNAEGSYVEESNDIEDIILSPPEYEYRKRNLKAIYNGDFPRIRFNGITLRSERDGLRRGDIIFLGLLIKNNGKTVNKDNLKVEMEYSEAKCDDVLYRTVNRLKKYAGIDFIRSERGRGYFLD